MEYDLSDVPEKELRAELAIRELLKDPYPNQTPSCAWFGCKGCDTCRAHIFLQGVRGGRTELRRRMKESDDGTD